MRSALCATLLAVVVISFAAAGEGNVALLTLPPNGNTGRSLLQIKKNCPVNLETAKYTEVTSRCKGPVYNESQCCAAFRDFSCPYGAYINDMTTNCAATMFSYLKLYGSYPPGLFANTCKHDLKNGLPCLAGETSAAATPAGSLIATAFAAAFCVYYVVMTGIVKCLIQPAPTS